MAIFKNSRRMTAVILCALLCAGSVSCGDTQKPKDSDADMSNNVESVAGSNEYVYPTFDLGEDTFTILNTSQNYSFYSYIDFESETGDTLDDIIYKRNRTVEEKFNFKMEVVEFELDEAANKLQTAVLSNDDVYDLAFIRDQYMSTAISEGYLQNLDDIPEIQLDCEWWDGKATDESRIGKSKKALFALTDVSLTDFEGTYVTFFNQDMFENLKLDLPYQLVLDGKWTFDRMKEFMAAGANLNGDDNWTLTENGKSVYGLVSFERIEPALLSGGGISFVYSNNEGYPEIGTSGDKFYTYFNMIKDSLNTEGEYLHANTGTSNDWGHYERVFKMGRALMMSAQLKAANNYRDMEYTYGVLPMPKYDENQAEYRNLRTFPCMMCVPVTNQRPHETGAIIDAMSYITYSEIMPYFYEGRMSHKMLRTDESIEMFEIIRETRCLEFGMAYGWVMPIWKEVHNVVITNDSIASTLASTLTSIEASIDKVMENIDK
ncbi:MAG: extracellular solute-binding protein [Clostridiales bacterium]|nr:extracellular solute-binding protein [Clostridiales bacterium]